MQKRGTLIHSFSFVFFQCLEEHFDAVDQGERYKWEAIAWYKKHWKIDSPNFAQMPEEAFGKAKNLLASAMYYPYRMITEYARVNPEEVRRIFKILYDESLPLEERYQVFRDSCKSGVDQIRAQNPEYEKAVNHYPDLRAIMVYLTFEYPEKYYLYKSTMYSDFRDRIGFREDKSNQSSVIGKVENFFRLCEIILAEVEKDQELIAKHKARLDNDCYADEALHLLTMDIVYYGSNYMSDKDFKTRPSVSAETAYWPSLEECNPGITTEMWKSVLCNPSVTSPENLDMLRKMLKLGGESTCAHLAETFGNTAGFYNALGTGFAGKVKNTSIAPTVLILKIMMRKSFTSFAGSEVAMALLFPMETLFESYIAALLKKKLGYADFAVSVQDKTYHLFDEPGKKFLMRPDIVVKRKADGAVFILDTKWKILADSKPNYGISQADMYQMYAYQKKYGANHVTLVYPKTDKVASETGMEYRSDDGVTVRTRFVDLFDVQKITQQLRADFF